MYDRMYLSNYIKKRKDIKMENTNNNVNLFELLNDIEILEQMIQNKISEEENQ